MDMGSYSFYYGDGGSKKRAAALGPVDVLIIHDSFDGMTLGDDLNGRTPDVVNTPGNDWVSGADDLESDGAGSIASAAVSDTGAIDTGITDNKMEASVKIVAGLSTNERNLYILGDAYAKIPADFLALKLESSGGFIQQRVAGSFSTLASAAGAVVTEPSTEYKFAIRYDGADARSYWDDVEIAALALVGYSFPAGFDGNSFVGIWSGSPTSATTQPLYDDFKVLDLP